MGCPVKNVVKMGACSALIKNPSLAKEIVLATKEGAGNMPVSVKTRIGFREIQTEEWIGFLLKECQPAVLTIHGRTVKEESKVPNHWDEIGKAVKLRDEIWESAKSKEQNSKTREGGSKTLILGNGDIQTLEEAYLKVAEFGLDGIMVGRGIFKNPWFFNPNVNIENVTIPQRLEVLKMHLELYKTDLFDHKNYNELKRFFKIYINGFAGSAEFRAKLMETHDVEEAKNIVSEYIA
jgi:tRNA-dihydrouridine synthase